MLLNNPLDENSLSKYKYINKIQDFSDLFYSYKFDKK